jgi:L-threonylcarbamoyladenylate synthase
MRRFPFFEDEHAAGAATPVAQVVAAGGVVLFPTETFYGLGVDPAQRDAVARVFSLKGRPPGIPLSVVCADWAQLEGLVEVPDAYRVRLSRIWPGPLTTVLRSRRELPASTGGTLAVRIPGHAMLRAVLYRSGPLTATSANRHGDPECSEVDAALASLVGPPDLVLDGGSTAGGRATTVVDLTGDVARVLRHGGLAWEERYPWLDDPALV